MIEQNGDNSEMSNANDSDSMPSEDNLDEEELLLIVPEDTFKEIKK